MRNKNYYIALTGAKKNVGDFLITERSLAFLNSIAPEYEFLVLPHWEIIQDLELINNSKGIIILGGPGFQRNMYPNVYKLREDLGEIKVSIYTLGCGFYGFPGTKKTVEKYVYTDKTKLLIDKMEKTQAGMSCRDFQTKRTLENNGYKNIKMTGCPVWYDIESLGKEFVKSDKIKKIIYTPAQKYRYCQQSKEVMKYLKDKFKDAEIIVSFHRGITEVDEFTSQEEVDNTTKIANYAYKLGLEVRDVAYSTEKIDFYDNCDLHIGYRVHANIYFLSKRLPSILLNEDGRGVGATEALLSPGINAFNEVSEDITENNINITKELDDMISEIVKDEYSIFNKICRRIDEHYLIMENYIKNIISENEV